jgi:IS6 family transposase
MPIAPKNPFEARQFPGEVIVLYVRRYLRDPLSYEHVVELMAERGVEVDASCIWRSVQVYAPERTNVAAPLKPTNKNYWVDETYIRVRARTSICIERSIRTGKRSISCSRPNVTL